ncbi:hypothetical protein V5799_018566 [Amblyomma americanum]|uniref:Uncharacterized protein n=1 Tax=Amblyomma americanum TaxID=6943 RepID=A0AAQ4F045_AMBAM
MEGGEEDPEVVAWELAQKQRRYEKCKARQAAETPESREARFAKRRQKDQKPNTRITGSKVHRHDKFLTGRVLRCLARRRPTARPARRKSIHTRAGSVRSLGKRKPTPDTI